METQPPRSSEESTRPIARYLPPSRDWICSFNIVQSINRSGTNIHPGWTARSRDKTISRVELVLLLAIVNCKLLRKISSSLRENRSITVKLGLIGVIAEKILAHRMIASRKKPTRRPISLLMNFANYSLSRKTRELHICFLTRVTSISFKGDCFLCSKVLSAQIGWPAFSTTLVGKRSGKLGQTSDLAGNWLALPAFLSRVIPRFGLDGDSLGSF